MFVGNRTLTEPEDPRPSILIKPTPKPMKIPSKPCNPPPTNPSASNKSIFDEYLSILQGVFAKMDDDNDGFISGDHIDLANIDPDLLEIIQGILLQIDEQREAINFPSFLNKIEENSLEVKIHCVKVLRFFRGLLGFIRSG